MQLCLNRYPVLVVFRLIKYLAWSCLATVLVCGSARAESVSGKASTVDGDGLILFGVEHRLHGIDAVEIDQRCLDNRKRVWSCGIQAKQMLETLVKDQIVTCEWTENDRYKRPLSTCSVNDINLNAAMVYAGYAVAYRRYSERYIDVEQRARKNASGIWLGEFLMPWVHRKNGRKAAIPVPDNARPVKGNINAKGKRYYHCPQDRSYANTRITEGRGERWFSSSSEAESAGWVRPQGYSACKI